MLRRIIPLGRRVSLAGPPAGCSQFSKEPFDRTAPPHRIGRIPHVLISVCALRGESSSQRPRRSSLHSQAVATPTPLGPASSTAEAQDSFSYETFGDTRMLSTSVINCDGSKWPLFFTPEQHSQLARFAEDTDSVLPSLTVVSGPPISGKSTVLHSVLPAMIAQHYQRQLEAVSAGALASDILARPLVIRVSLNPEQGPAAAAQHILEEVARALAPKGFSVSLERDADVLQSGWALRHFEWTMQNAARQLRCYDIRMWLLIDNIEVSCRTWL